MPVRPLVMGILNVTPDSFSDGGRFVDVDRAVDHGRQLARQGAAIVDVGGESTRPGAHPVAADEEAARVVPVVAALAAHVRVSVDTAKAEVAAALFAEDMPRGVAMSSLLDPRQPTSLGAVTAELPTLDHLPVELRGRNNALLSIALAPLREPVAAAVDRHGADRAASARGRTDR